MDTIHTVFQRRCGLGGDRTQRFVVLYWLLGGSPDHLPTQTARDRQGPRAVGSHQMGERRIPGFANVPYRIRSFDEIIADPQDTIWFDNQLHEDIENRVAQLGSDHRLMNAPNGQMLKSSLMEKLLISWLTKLYNFIPEAGIWMNTQRPEWNDANNALVGNGVSMVTLNYMRRFTQFLMDWVCEEGPETFRLHEEVRDLLRSCRSELEAHKGQLVKGWDDKARRKLSVALGRHGETYRERAYRGFGMRHVAYAKEDLLAAFELSIQYMDQTIECNRKDNGLYHAYNLIHLGKREWKVTELYDMLEGQVAVLSSGLLNDKQSLEVLNALKGSELFRPDQFSYLLYPNRDIPGFFNRNHIPEDRLEKTAFCVKCGSVETNACWRRMQRARAISMEALPMHRMCGPSWSRSSMNTRSVEIATNAMSWAFLRTCSTTRPSPEGRERSSLTKASAAYTGTWSPNFCGRSGNAASFPKQSAQGPNGGPLLRDQGGNWCQ